MRFAGTVVLVRHSSTGPAPSSGSVAVLTATASLRAHALPTEKGEIAPDSRDAHRQRICEFRNRGSAALGRSFGDEAEETLLPPAGVSAD